MNQLTSGYGRALSGKRAMESFDDSPRDKLTLVSAISLNGLFAECEFKGSMDKARFEIYSRDILIPTLKSGDTLLMDNLSSHKSKEVKELFKEKGINILYLPPYTPEYNPIEMMWAKIKSFLRKNRSKDILQLKENITKAFSLVNIDDIKGWFNHCGYPCTLN